VEAPAPRAAPRRAHHRGRHARVRRASRADVTELVNQIGGLQREVRELRREVEAR
jgi:phage host-nuclease inhibitor protein Gam